MMDSKHAICTGKLRNMASVYLRRDNQILLLYRQGSSIVSNLWIGSAGGHFEPDELNDAKACVLRELKEELGLTEFEITDLSLRYVTIRHNSGELRQNYYFFANFPDNRRDSFTSTEGICQWFDLHDLSMLDMPFTARYMIDHYLAQGQFDDVLYGGIANQDGVIFLPL